MSKDFLIVNKHILPDYLDKVIYARTLIETHEVPTVIEAVKKVGISRNTYYKYKDYVFTADDTSASSRKAVLSFVLKDESGTLSSLINQLTDLGTSILTISQSIPISGKANVLISLDINSLSCTSEELIHSLKQIHGVRSVHLDAIE
jgi:chorismate mutase